MSEGNGGGLRPQGAGVEANSAGISFMQGELRETEGGVSRMWLEVSDGRARVRL